MNNTLSKFMTFLFLFGSAVSIFSQTSYIPPTLSRELLKDINFGKAKPVDESYRATFAQCDKTPKCSEDKNKLAALLKFDDGTIFYQSKMGLDLDGSWKACSCGEKGPTDQCRTSYLWDPAFPTDKQYRDESDKCVFFRKQAFVDAETIPYMVIPGGPKFGGLTNLKVGDLGVVVFKGKMIPVFVADAGPDFRIGEGSAALLRAVGVDRCTKKKPKNNPDGHCTNYKDASIEEGVLFFVFPGSKIPGLKRETAPEVIKEKAMKRFEEFKRSLN